MHVRTHVTDEWLTLVTGGRVSVTVSWDCEWIIFECLIKYKIYTRYLKFELGKNRPWPILIHMISNSLCDTFYKRLHDTERYNQLWVQIGNAVFDYGVFYELLILPVYFHKNICSSSLIVCSPTFSLIDVTGLVHRCHVEELWKNTNFWSWQGHWNDI